MTTYHLVNGSNMALYLKRIGVKGSALDWHDAPIHGPHGVNLPYQQHVALRSDFLAAFFELNPDDIAARFAKRTEQLEGIKPSDEVVLWLSDEPYDALIILNAVYELTQRGFPASHFKLVTVSDRVPPWDLEKDALIQLYKTRIPANDAFVNLCLKVWQHIDDKSALEQLQATESFSHWPKLARLLARYCEEHEDDLGLNRTKWQLLEALEQGPLTLAQLFGANQQLEPTPFLGDASVWRYLMDLHQYIDVTGPFLNTPSASELESAPKYSGSLLNQEVFFYHQHMASLTEKGKSLL